MNWLDAAIILVIIWLTYAAFQAGFIREVITIVAAVLGVVLAGLFYKDLAADVLVFIDNEAMARITGFAIIFLALVLAGQMMALILKPTVHVFQLGIFDQLVGAAFGFLKAIVFIQIFLILFITYPKWGLEDTIDGSTFGRISVRVVDRAPVILEILPGEFRTQVDDFVDRL